MMRISIILILCSLFSTLCRAQDLSFPAQEYLRHRSAEAIPHDPDCPIPVVPLLLFKSRHDTLLLSLSSTSKVGSRLSYGFHPYWSGDGIVKNYQWDLLTHIGYFGADIDPLTGGISNTHNWKTTTIRDSAHKHGVRVELVTVLFSRHDSLLLYPGRRAKAIENLVKLVRDYQGDGINIDFEAIPKTSKDGFHAFVKELHEYVASDTTFSISLDLPAIDWNNIFDLPFLQQYVDVFFMMGYDYYWSAAPSSGPVAPLDLGYYNLRRSVTTHLANGLPKEKFVLGLPWYGYDWATKDSTAPGSETLNRASAITPSDAIEEAAFFGRHWNDAGKSAYYYYLLNDTIHQVWYDDEESLAAKYALANEHDLIGIGYWAVPYAAARPTFWAEIEKALVAPSSVSASVHGRSASVVYPNPAKSNIQVSLPTPEPYEVYSILGDRLLKGVTDNPIDLSALPNGRYYLRLGLSEQLVPFTVLR